MPESSHPPQGYALFPDATPVEVIELLATGGYEVVAVQPGGYARTQSAISAWVSALAGAPQVLVTDIHPEEDEAPIPGVSAARIAEGIGARATYVPQVLLMPRELARFSGRVAVVGRRLCELVSHDSEAERQRVHEPRHIAVAMGGDSAEREVSLHSGRAVVEALRSSGYRVTPIDFSEVLLSGGSLSMLTGEDRPDKVFLALHGTRAEDGAIQGLLELLHLPYTGSDIQTSAIAMDKQLTKTFVSLAGVPVPWGKKLGRNHRVRLDEIWTGKMIVKPNAQGSTVGLRFVDALCELEEAIDYALHYDDEVLVEECVEGVEVSVPVLAGQALPVVEIVPASGRYDFESKYTPNATEEICPARLSPEMTERLQGYALQAHQVLGCRGATRSDFIVGPDGPRFLEINTLPGLTPTSLLPRSAGVAGLTFVQLCEAILDDC